MADYTAKQINEMEAAFGGGMKKARAELGVQAFGMQVIDLPPNYADYPEHDHGEDGQEEVYSVMQGSGEIDIEGERIPLTPDVLVRVGPGTKRKRLLRARRSAPAGAGRHAGLRLRGPRVHRTERHERLAREAREGLIGDRPRGWVLQPGACAWSFRAPRPR